MEKTKERVSISIDRELNKLLDDEIINKSKYIEYLIYVDMIKNTKNDKIKNIIL